MGSLKLGQGPEGTQVIKKHFQCIDVLSIITYICTLNHLLILTFIEFNLKFH